MGGLRRPEGVLKRYSKVIVALVIALNVLFAVAVFWLMALGHEEPDALIAAWYSFTGAELLALAGIKITESRNRKDEDSDEGPDE